ncbi:MAG: secretin and TonB N-terminal domain-containing protein, partial [Myxococcales bacterium]|nr:secretin and TonB N-terminal domain-containing protein [Myxococcales bacterium]
MRSIRHSFSVVLCLVAIASPAAAQTSEALVRGLEVSGSDQQAHVVITGDFDVPRYTVRARDDGRSVVLEVDGARIGDQGLDVDGRAGLVATTATSATARGVRLQLGLSAQATHRVRASAGRIELILERPGAGVEASPPDASGPAEVRAIHVERRDGRDRVVVQLSRSATFRTLPSSSGPARLVIEGTRLGSNVPRTLAVDAADDMAVRGVRVREERGRAMIEVDQESGSQGTAIREGDRIVWLFTPTAPRAERPRSRTIAREAWAEALDADADADAVDETLESEEVAAFLSDVPMQLGRARGTRSYRGRRIDLDFHNADIHNILRLIAEVGGVNIVTSDDVSGTVTIRMRNVPWDQALDVILQAKGLGMVRRGNLIRVAPLSSLEKERELAIARQKQQIELAPLETRLIPVSYAVATDLSPRVQELLTTRGNVSVDERTNVLIVRDTIESLDDVEELIRTLDTQTPQVLVEARIVEATSQYVRDVGIQWGGNVLASTATGNPTGLIFPSSVGVTGGNYDQNSPTAGLTPFAPRVATPNYAVNLPATTSTGAGGAL